MILAELEVFHSRPVAPTRRVALGRLDLPVEPPPGFGGILLGGVMARNAGLIAPDLLPELTTLIALLESGDRVSQPRLRYRLQRDRVGLQRSRHRLVGQGDTLGFVFDDEHGDPTQQMLGAVYAAGGLPTRFRHVVMGTIRRGIAWPGPVGPDLISALAGFDGHQSFSMKAVSHPYEWALSILGFKGNGPSGLEIRRAYRQLLIEAHPDHGGEADDAAQRIADLFEARRILLGQS